MRATTLLRRWIGVTALWVRDVWWSGDGQVSVEVRPRWRRARCGECGKHAPGFDRRPARRWRHLPWGRTAVWLVYAPRRVACRHCGIRVEQVPWAESGGRATSAFEELVAYLAQGMDFTRVSRLMGISWATVRAIIERVVERRLDGERLSGLRRIGIDEFSYRKRHRYLTVVVDHDRRRVVWAAEGRSAEALGRFFAALPAEERAAIELVTMDMAGGYLKAVRQWAPQAQIVFDRFHVERLMSDAVDKVRRELVREMAGRAEAVSVKKLRYVLLKNPQHLTVLEEARLSDVEQRHRKLYRAYLLKEAFAEALELKDPELAEWALQQWLAWASRSRLAPFVKAARTVRRHFQGVLAYVQTRFTNAVVEGFNTRLRLIARRAFGFHSPRPLIALLFLTCGGIQLNPPLPTRT